MKVTIMRLQAISQMLLGASHTHSCHNVGRTMLLSPTLPSPILSFPFHVLCALVRLLYINSYLLSLVTSFSITLRHNTKLLEI